MVIATFTEIIIANENLITNKTMKLLVSVLITPVAVLLAGTHTPNPNDAKNIKAKVLVLHGADDSFVPEEQVKAFENEMRQANVDWQLISYGRTVHAFTNPEYKGELKGVLYNPIADQRSWQDMRQFFAEIFRK